MWTISLSVDSGRRAGVSVWLLGLAATCAALSMMGCQQNIESGSPATEAEQPIAPSQVTLDPSASAEQPSAPGQETPDASASVRLPRLLDLGAGKCIPCKLMAPILEEMKKEYAGSMDVVFIDVWEDSTAGEKYGIQSIPTQIFFDASGKELFRHEGFFAKEEILAKWKELGFDF